MYRGLHIYVEWFGAFIFIYKIFLFCVGVELMDNAVIMSGD